jgi:hypothetical protein
VDGRGGGERDSAHGVEKNPLVHESAPECLDMWTHG